MEITIFLKYIGKIGIMIKVFFTTRPGMIFLLPVFAAPVYTTAQKALLFLGILFTLDFITGVWASYNKYVSKLENKPKGIWKIILTIIAVIESTRLRLSAVKFATYAMVVFFAKLIEWTFINGEFEPHASLQKMTFTTIVIALLCCIEMYSIFFENLKKIGFDLEGKIKSMSNKGWSIYKTIKNENDEQSTESN